MTIPFLELKPGYEEFRDEFDAAYHRVMESGYYLMGNEIKSLEQEFADYCGTQHCVAVGSGLDALYFPLLAFGLGPGDEVIVPAQTFIATWFAVSFTGATPIPVDVCLQDGNLDPQKIEAAITEKTKAIIPVDLFGIPCKADDIQTIAEKHNLIVIEDAAQAHGATRKGQRCGAMFSSAAFSFYPGKNMGAFGDGGCLTTNDADLAQQIRLLRNYGAPRKYDHVQIGYNSRLDELQAAFLRVKLSKLDLWHARRRAQAERYQERLSNIEGLTLVDIVPDFESSWHLFPIFSPHRQALQDHLESKQIKTLRHYPTAPPFAEAYSEMNYSKDQFPFAAQMADEELSLPLGPQLPIESVDIVCDEIESFFKTNI